jgi:hypothetical protein
MVCTKRTREILLAAAVTVLAPGTAPALDLGGSLGEAGGHGRYVAPISNPIFNETPYITTEARPMHLHQEIPDKFLTGGGDIDVIAVQLRVALTERLGFIATKDGWADIDFDSVLDDESGFANLAFGFKYAILSNPETCSLLTAGVRYEAPSGSLSSSGISLQGSGDGLFDLFLTGAHVFGPLGLQASVGTQLAIDGSHDTSFVHYSVHADWEILDRAYPTLELNGFSPIEDGSRTAVGVNGLDLVNLGSANSKTVVTIAPGLRLRLTDNVLFGMAFEVPMTDAEDLMDWRLTTDFVLHL